MDTPGSHIKFPITRDGVESFLASPFVAGIGAAYARRLIDAFGSDAVEKLTVDSATAATAAGIPESAVEKAAESIGSMKADAGVVIFLFSCGLGSTVIERLVDKYKTKLPGLLCADPYNMIEDAWRVSFRDADRIGRTLAIATDDPRRLQGALVAAVKLYADDGHLFATTTEAIDKAADIAGVAVDEIAPVVIPAVASGRLIESDGNLYIPVFYHAESLGASRLAALAKASAKELDATEIPADGVDGITYSPAQLRAIETALHSQVTVLTGGPGTGKTTVLREIIAIFKNNGLKVTAVAPTGKAAKRLATLTGTEASTIHRLLGYRDGRGYSTRLIDTDVLIIDEGSMMEQVLLDHLLEALRPGTKVIIVGDPDQLPAIGAGDVLRQLIDSEMLPVIRLDENFRQSAGSLIAAGARAVNMDLYPESSSDGDLMIIPEKTTAKIKERIFSLITTELPARSGIAPTDILVVTPRLTGPLGARALNEELRSRINPSGPELLRGATIFRLGDPVMQTVNSRERGVYNGETGRITAVDTANACLTVTFADGKTSIYARTELGEINPAYATTVHKLQGSEAPYIIIPMSMTFREMLYRNLLYTAISRATRLCVIVGQEEAIVHAIATTKARRRNSRFAHRLRSEFRDFSSDFS